MARKSTSEKAGTTVSSFGAVDGADAQRLSDQKSVQQHVEKIRAAPAISTKRDLLDQIAFYPKHAKRTETPAYKAAHKLLVVTKDLPCLVCGVKNHDASTDTRLG